MLRDSRRDTAYFDEWIEFRQSTIDEGIDKVYPSAKGQGLHVSDLFSNAMKNCIMKYGRGDDFTSMKDSVWQALEMREKMVITLKKIEDEAPNISKMYGKLNLYNYLDSLALLCFVIAAGGAQEDIKRTLEASDYTGQDILLDKVAALIKGTVHNQNMATKLVFPKIYKPLLEVIDAPAEQRHILMKKFVEGWYKSMKPAAWYDNDQGGEGAYYGYWCFEAALIVRLLEIDDSSFCDNIYYPVDMVHS